MKRFAVMLGLGGALLLCGFNASVRPVHVDGRRCVSLADAARMHNWQMEIAPDGRSVTVSGIRGEMKLVHNSAVGIFYDVRLALSGKVLRQPDGMWVMGEDDLWKTLKPLLKQRPLPPTPVRRIVIDAGHGGRDPGAVREGVEEKSINLRLATRLVPLLEARGFEVILTREDDRALSLDARADKVRAENGDLFLSIHQNAAANTGAQGLEVYFFPDARYAVPAMHLAHAILSSVLIRTGGLGTAEDRGIKRAGFRVLRKADCPAVLLECGFLSNEQERMKLMQDAYLDKLAEGIATGFEAYRILLGPQDKEGEE